MLPTTFTRNRLLTDTKFKVFPCVLNTNERSGIRTNTPFFFVLKKEVKLKLLTESEKSN